MKYEITKIAPHKTAKVTSLVLTLALLPIFLILMAFAQITPDEDSLGTSLVFAKNLVFSLPITFLILCYLFTLSLCLIYNQICKLTGGVTFDVSEH